MPLGIGAHGGFSNAGGASLGNSPGGGTGGGSGFGRGGNRSSSPGFFSVGGIVSQSALGGNMFAQALRLPSGQPGTPWGFLVGGGVNEENTPFGRGLSRNSKFKHDTREQRIMRDILRRASTWPPAKR